MTEDTNSTSTSVANSPSSDGSIHEESLQKEVCCACNDGDVMVRLSLISQSSTFTDMMRTTNTGANELKDGDKFLMKSVSARVFKKVVNWMENHVGQPEPELEEDPNTRGRKWFTLTDFEKEFFQVKVEELAELLEASSFLNLQSLYRHSCQAMAAVLKDRSPEEIRDLLGIEDDLDDNQKDVIRRKNVWCNY